MYAAASNLVSACSVLLEAGAHINATDLDGCTSLHMAYLYGSSSAVAFLEGNGADSNALNNISRLPLESSGCFDKFPPLFFGSSAFSNSRKP